MNLSKFPTITVAKTITLGYNQSNSASQVFFNFDYAIDNSILKGIRFEFGDNSASGVITPTPPASIRYNPLNFYSNNPSVAGVVIGSYFGITLVDKKNNIILNNYPINGLNNPDLSLPNTNFIRRFNSEIDLSKSFISLIDKTQAPLIFVFFDQWNLSFTFYYKPKN